MKSIFKKWCSLLSAFLLVLVLAACSFGPSTSKPVVKLSGFPYLSSGMDIRVVSILGDNQDISDSLGKVPEDFSPVTVNVSLKKNVDYFVVCLCNGNSIEYGISVKPGELTYDIAGYWSHNRSFRSTLDSFYGVNKEHFFDINLNTSYAFTFDDAPFYYLTLNKVKGKRIFINALDSSNVHVSYSYEKTPYLKERHQDAVEVKTNKKNVCGFEAAEDTVYVGVIPLSYEDLFNNKDLSTYVNLAVYDVTEDSEILGNIEKTTNTGKGNIYYTKDSDNTIYTIDRTSNKISEYLDSLAGLPITQMKGEGEILYIAAKNKFYIYDTKTKTQSQDPLVFDGNITSFAIKNGKGYFFYKLNDTDEKSIFRVMDLTANPATEIFKAADVYGGTELSVDLDDKMIIDRIDGVYGYLFWDEDEEGNITSVYSSGETHFKTDANYVYNSTSKLLVDETSVAAFYRDSKTKEVKRTEYSVGVGSLFDSNNKPVSISGFAKGSCNKDDILYAVVKTGDDDTYVIEKYDMSGKFPEKKGESRKYYNIVPRHIFVDDDGNVSLVVNSTISIYESSYLISVFNLDSNLKEIEDSTSASRSAGKANNMYFNKRSTNLSKVLNDSF